MSSFTWGLALVLSMVLQGCGTEHQKVSRADAIRFYLNNRDYEQAIALLKEQLNENPGDDSAKILLASAYSGSVGINTVDAFEVLRPKLFSKPISSGGGSSLKSLSSTRSTFLEGPFFDLAEAEPLPGSQTDIEIKRKRAILAIEKELYKFSAQAAEAMEIAFRLPHLPLEKRDRLVLSLSLLVQIPESSSEYQTAQLYGGILSLIQFLNYFRDAIPSDSQVKFSDHIWYVSVYCQLDLSILLPNINRSVDYLTSSFVSFSNAGRKSENPVYENLLAGSQNLSLLNANFLVNQDLFEIADVAVRTSKPKICQE